MYNANATQQNMADVKNGTYSTKVKEKSSSFKRGAIIGGITGLVCAFMFKGRFVLWTVAGAVGGGFIAYKMMDNQHTEETKFQNYK